MSGFKENLKAELVYSGMLVKELAAKTGVKKHTIDNYLNTHNSIPAADSAVRIAQALGVSVEYLVTGEEMPCKKPGPGKRSPRGAPGKQPPLSAAARQAAQLVDSFTRENRVLAIALLKALKAHDPGGRAARGMLGGKE
jgi:transcriptional regulator with XRE-family HTH domain